MNVYMARQPIFDTENHVFGYELLYRSNGSQNQYNGLDGDASTADVITNAFFGLDIRDIIGNGKAFINFTANLLKRGVPKMISPDLVVVEVLENLMMDDKLLGACQELKERGYTLALDDFEYDNSYSQLFELGDIVKIDFRTPQKSIEETAYICRYSNKVMLAEKIETREEFEWAKKLGCSFMQGYFFAKPTIMSKNSLTPLPVNFMRVMQLISQPEPEFSDIVDVISCDTAMCQRLLRLINSVYFGVRNRVSSIGQALVILGLDYLREWIYLMGLLSMVTYGGERALAQALDEFPLTQEIKDGLMGKGGVYSDVFDLAYSYEKGDWATVDKYVEKYHLDSSRVSEAFVKCVKESERIRMM